MPVTTTYAIENIKAEFLISYSANVNTPTDERNPSLLALADGGFAVVYERQSSDPLYRSAMYLERYTADGTIRPGPDVVGTTQLNVSISTEVNSDPAITQQTGGAIVTTWTQATSDSVLRFVVVDPVTGGFFTGDTLLPGTDGGSAFSDIAVMRDDLVVVRQEAFSSTDEDADLLSFPTNLSDPVVQPLGDNSELDEQNPAVAVLNNGNIVVAYEKEKTDDTDTFGMAVEIYTPTGELVLAPFTFDIAGDQNRAPEVVALNDGGFAVVYQDDQYGHVGISIAVFTQAGALTGIHQVDVTGRNTREPAVAVLSNGFVAITWTEEFSGVDDDIDRSIFDPFNMTFVVDTFLAVDFGDENQSSIIALANGAFVSAWTNEASEVSPDPDGSHVSLQIDALVRSSEGDAADDTIVGDGLRDDMLGAGGADVMYAFGNNDVLNDGGADAPTVRDVMYGGTGNDTYEVWNTLTSAQDIVFENNVDNGAQGGSPSDVDTIISHGEFFRDFYSTGEVLRIADDANVQFATTYLVGGANSNAQISGNSGSNIISTYGGSKAVDAGAGTDAISFSRYDLDASFEGVNTLVSRAGTGIDYLYDFQSGVDKVDLRAFNFGITGQQVLDQGVNVVGSDPNSSADDYCYFYLTNAGGADNYVAFVGLTTAQLQANDFITA